jgi:SAM-dependent methyltransferase|tara:strand:- start:1189 stop:1893 length:705 start_codon:yes stop_codon:yes gene_type:complete
MSVFEQSIIKYHLSKTEFPFSVRTNFGDDQTYYASYFYRSYEVMPDIEQLALDNCKGKILDVGAGTGSHSLYLQEKGFDVTAIEISESFCEVLIERGVKSVLCQDYYTLKGLKFDTAIFMMNGIGISKTIDGFIKLLNKLKELLNKDGVAYIDSADIIYMFDTPEDLKYYEEEVEYYGEIEYHVSDDKNNDPPFQWLFIDKKMLSYIAEANGFGCEIMLENDYKAYLAKLWIKE